MCILLLLFSLHKTRVMFSWFWNKILITNLQQTFLAIETIGLQFWQFLCQIADFSSKYYYYTYVVRVLNTTYCIKNPSFSSDI